jgi:hypothetical protein
MLTTNIFSSFVGLGIFLASLHFELRASYLLDGHSTTWASLQALGPKAWTHSLANVEWSTDFLSNTSSYCLQVLQLQSEENDSTIFHMWSGGTNEENNKRPQN